MTRHEAIVKLAATLEIERTDAADLIDEYALDAGEVQDVEMIIEVTEERVQQIVDDRQAIFAIISGEWSWDKLNSLNANDFFAFEDDALEGASAEKCGKRRIIADGQIALTPVRFTDRGYLVEDLRGK